MTDTNLPSAVGRDPWSPSAVHGAGVADASDALEVFRERARSGRLPQPGSGTTVDRFTTLADAGRRSLSAGRLFEAHTDAQTILLEAGWDDPEALGLLGVWASDRHRDPVELRRAPHGWTVRGNKPFCSGAPLLDQALVTAASGADRHLCLIDLGDPTVEIHPSTWAGTGMRGTATRSVELRDTPVTALVGGVGWYLERPGFWHGAVGVAASWFGGALGILDTLRAGVDGDDPHQLAHLGDADALGYAVAGALELAARQIDDDPGDGEAARQRALRVRRVTASACLAIIEHAAGALGPRSLAFDGDHAQRVADLDLYVRQDHGRRDAETLGRLVAAREDRSC